MNSLIKEKLQNCWTLLRLIAVISSSIVAILSSLLPILLYTSISAEYLFLMFLFLSFAATIFHGVLVHLLNDYADFYSGTDAHSPAILSGGSRVIQRGFMRPELVWKIGKGLILAFLVMAIFLAIFGQYELAILILVGVWAAVSYSLPPLRLSYRPFLGECLSLFPAVFFLGIAGPWLILEAIPLWAYQNAIINTLVCMSWVMVHHIPDVQADQRAVPKKWTSVVWCVEKFGLGLARLPASIYLFLAVLCTVWVMDERMTAGLTVLALLLVGLVVVMKINPSDANQVTVHEKILLMLAVLIALLLGVLR